jgi:hypothetical protein
VAAATVAGLVEEQPQELDFDNDIVPQVAAAVLRIEELHFDSLLLFD